MPCLCCSCHRSQENHGSETDGIGIRYDEHIKQAVYRYHRELASGLEQKCRRLANEVTFSHVGTKRRAHPTGLP